MTQEYQFEYVWILKSNFTLELENFSYPFGLH